MGVIVWVEPYLVAGHAIVLNTSVNDVTVKNLFDQYKRFKNSVLQQPNKYLRSEAGCQSSYAPYSGFEVQLFVLDLLDELERNILNKEGNYLFTWLGRIKWARQKRIEIKPQWRAKDDRTRYLRRIDIDD